MLCNCHSHTRQKFLGINKTPLWETPSWNLTGYYIWRITSYNYSQKILRVHAQPCRYHNIAQSYVHKIGSFTLRNVEVYHITLLIEDLEIHQNFSIKEHLSQWRPILLLPHEDNLYLDDLSGRTASLPNTFCRPTSLTGSAFSAPTGPATAE